MNNRARAHPMAGRQGGQALTEFVVLTLVVVPLFLVVPRLGKLLDLYQTTERASRYAAFEATVHHTGSDWKSDVQLAQELRQRFYAGAAEPLVSPPVARKPTASPFWTDAANRGLLAHLDQAVQVESATLRRNVLTAASLQARQLNLPNNNRYRVSVTVDPAKLPGLQPFDRINLDSTRKTVLLVDTWAARHPAEIRQRLESAPVLLPLQAIRPLVDAVGQLPRLLFDPALRLDEYDGDAVPCDRLDRGCP